MGFIQRLAKKVRGFVAPLGQKIGDGFRAGLKFVGDNVEKERLEILLEQLGTSQRLLHPSRQRSQV